MVWRRALAAAGPARGGVRRQRQRRRCSGGDSSKPISIGASLPLTGDFSEPGKAAQQGYQVWQKMVNDQGGLLGRKVQIVVATTPATRTRSSPTTTR